LHRIKPPLRAKLWHEALSLMNPCPAKYKAGEPKSIPASIEKK
jgi:hypothetical protein